jgi:hypothetical protein
LQIVNGELTRFATIRNLQSAIKTMSNLGYEDTPILPGMPWRVHDSHRPQPAVVTPGTQSTPDQPGRAPSDAVLLFDGSDLSQWAGKSGAAAWNVADGFMEVAPGSGNIHTKQEFGDCQLHLEWAAPTTVKGESQGRGNSGVFLLGLYEVQVLDNYDNPTYADGTAGAVYGQYPPLVNACRPPGEWQDYDIFFQAPRFNDNGLISPAYITVVLNGVLLHHHRSIQGPTQHRVLASYEETRVSRGPLELQDHGDLVRYRNIWMRELKDYDQA